jgi:hypothetical protein
MEDLVVYGRNEFNETVWVSWIKFIPLMTAPSKHGN